MGRKSDFEKDRGCLYSGTVGVGRCVCGGEGRYSRYRVVLTFNDGLRVDFVWFCGKCWVELNGKG